MSEINKENLFDPYSVEIEESTELSEILNYTDILIEVSKALIKYRNKNNLTQKQLAKKLNVNQSRISKLEKGNYNATLKLLLNISYKLEKDSSLFLEIIENIRNVLEYKEEYKYKIINDYKIQSVAKICTFNNCQSIELNGKKMEINEIGVV